MVLSKPGQLIVLGQTGITSNAKEHALSHEKGSEDEGRQ